LVHYGTMGQSVSDMTAKIKQQQDEAKKRVQAELSQLEATLNAKKEAYEAKIMMDKPSDKTLPIDTVVAKKSIISVNVSTSPSPQFQAALDDLFGGSYLSALKAVALMALNAVLGNAEAGSKEQIDYKVMFLYNAVIRVDYMLYSYTLSSEGVSKDVTNGVCFVCTISTIKLSAINSEVIAYVLGEQADKGGKFLGAMLESITNEQLSNKAARVISKPEDLSAAVANAKGSIYGRYKTQLSEDDKKNLDKDPPSPMTPAYANSVFDIYDKFLAQEKVQLQDPSRSITSEQEKMLAQLQSIYKKIDELKLSLKRSS